MTFLNRFFENVFDESTSFETLSNSFDQADPQQLEQHLKISHYDGFELTDAVRPAMDLKIKPVQGYRHDVYVDSTEVFHGLDDLLFCLTQAEHDAGLCIQSWLGLLGMF